MEQDEQRQEDAEPLFYSGNGLESGLTLAQIAERIFVFIGERCAGAVKIWVGTDSPGKPFAAMTSTITLYRPGNGGRYYWTRQPAARFHTTKDRLFAEAMRSITLMQELRSALRERIGEGPELCGIELGIIHVDVSKDGKSKSLANAITGMVQAYGFHPELKPLAFAASCVADRHT